jgi:hypothetical protein
MPGVEFFNMKATFGGRFNSGDNSGGIFNKEAASAGNFQYRGGFGGRIYLWSRILGAFVLSEMYIKGMSAGFFQNHEGSCREQIYK